MHPQYQGSNSFDGRGQSGHPQHRGGDRSDCSTERYEMAVEY